MIADVGPVELFRVVVLVALAGVLVYPTVAYGRNVMHTGALHLLTGTLVVLAIAVVVQGVGGASVLSEGLQLSVAAGVLGSSWLFAREFVTPGTAASDDSIPVVEEVELTAVGGGFEDVERE